MADRATTAESITYRQREAQAMPREVQQEAAAQEAETGNEVKAKSRLSVGEKVTFGVAAVFSTAILIVCVFLTIMGFIFSPIADTLVFGLLMGATGMTSYVIWRGGK
jgi:hypothetical protein